jgi:hypothetical protein
LALLVLQSVRVGALQVRSSDPRRVHDQIVKLSGEISIGSVLDFVWDCGIPVIPLRDPGAFHGAWWRIDGQDIIVVKQTTSSTARWIIDILHEYFHSATEPDSSDGAIVEEREPTHANSGSEAEQLATEFAVRTALNERQEQLAEACVKAAHGKVEWLKSAVPQVAARENVDLAMLANYMAYRLSFQDINWWPTAQGLQSSSEDPWAVAASKLLQRLEMDRLAPADRDLLIQALA